jgi:DNA-binding GntR family transcriptional regulator
VQERIYQTLRKRILNGGYDPGHRLVIDSLARDFGVSGIPVREAIRRLEAEGLIVYRPNVGPQVTQRDARLYEEELEAVAVLEGYATALAAPDLTPGDLERLREINSELLECANASDSFGFSRRNFDSSSRRRASA